MSGRRDSLTPPTRTGLADPGAHELDASDSDDHFSDAQSGPAESNRTSPIPKTRVEKVDNDPSYGEVPGTEAYRMREGDAEPDEIAVIPDASYKSPASGSEEGSRPPTPGGHPVPKTVVEVTPDTDGSVTHPGVEKRHKFDPPPDLVLKAESATVKGGDGEEASDTPISPALKTPNTARSRRKSSVALQRSALSPSSSGPRSAGLGADQEDGDDFGDDFDDFEEVNEEADFGDFDDGFQEPDAQPDASPAAAAPPAPRAPPTLSFPIPDFDGLDTDDIFAATEPYLDALFPEDEDDPTPTVPSAPRGDNPVFLTPRSASLWSQLVAPPPLQPPDWIRSRIRRLFLVSLGVPVDLDEILPASKQKKLVLPSLRPASSSGSLRVSSSSADGARRSLSRLRREGANASSASVDSQGRSTAAAAGAAAAAGPGGGGGGGGTDAGAGAGAGRASRRRKGPPAEPAFDLVAAEQVCTTTDEALDGMTDDELRAHVGRVEAMQETAKEVLEYWQKRTDEKIGDREAFEGVIENLVKHARKVRK